MIQIYDIYIYPIYMHASMERFCKARRPLMCNSGEQYIYVGDICLIYMPNI